MLSAKYSRKHGMKNEKWNTKEKIMQYRAILKLFARDKKLRHTNGEKLKRKISRNLRELTTDIKSYRSILNDVITGDKRLLRMVLQTQKDFQIVLQDAVPLEAHRAIFQDYNLKRKQLDKILHLKEKTTKDYCELKIEYADLSEKIEKKNELSESEIVQQKREQQLMARYQVALAKRHAAKSIEETYKEIIVILQKDAKYFDGVLNALRGDQRDQCRIIYKATIMGQLATEDLDDIRVKYKKMARDVWVNMKEREMSLEVVRRRAEDVWEYAKSLVRVESDTNLLKKHKDTAMTIDQKLQNQIKQLEDIFNTMKESMLIQSYEELFVRLQDQMHQRQRLSELYTRKLKERDFILKKKNHADVLLQNLEHSVVSTTSRYKIEKKAILEKIKEEKERQIHNETVIESHGQLLVNIRAALQNMASMILCVKVQKTTRLMSKRDRKSSRSASKEVENDKKEKEKEIKESANPCADPVENDGLEVLAQVTRKAIALFGMTNFELDRTKREKARNAYESYIADNRSKLKFGDGEPEQSGMYFEHEVVDPSVLTRTDIKHKSKVIVEIHTRED